jgi:hypothetical protein
MISRPLEAGLRVAVAVVVLATLAWQFGKPVIERMLPLLAWEIEAVVPQFRVLSASIGSGGPESVVTIQAGPAPVVMIADKLLPLAPHSRFETSTPAGHVLQPLVLLLAILIAWPTRDRKRYLLRLALALPLLVLLPMLDVPLVLAAELEAALIDLGRPGMFSALDAWKSFLEGGGRLALPIFVASAGIALAEAGGRPTAEARR